MRCHYTAVINASHFGTTTTTEAAFYPDSGQLLQGTRDWIWLHHSKILLHKEVEGKVGMGREWESFEVGMVGCSWGREGMDLCGTSIQQGSMVLPPLLSSDVDL